MFHLQLDTLLNELSYINNAKKIFHANVKRSIQSNYRGFLYFEYQAILIFCKTFPIEKFFKSLCDFEHYRNRKMEESNKLLDFIINC